MKLKIFLFIISVLLIGCSNPQKKLINEAQIFLKSTLNDPKSYQPESFKIYDTMTVLAYVRNVTKIDLESADFWINIRNKRITSDKEEIETYNILKIDPKTFKDNLKKDKRELDSLNVIKDRLIHRTDSLKKITVDNSTIKYIYLLASYRAKNSFNAVIKIETKILYDYKKRRFEILPD